MFGLALTDKTVRLSRYEIEALIDWHIEGKRQCADKEEFTQAEDHRARAHELAKILAAPQEFK